MQSEAAPSTQEFGIVMTVVERPTQVEWAIQHFRTVYPLAPFTLISDGKHDPLYAEIASYYSGKYIIGDKLKLPERGALWWQRFFSEARNLNTTYVLKVDPDTRFNRPIHKWPDGECFGTITCKGSPREHIQGGVQGFTKDVIRRIIHSQICLDKEFERVAFWAWDLAEVDKWQTTNYLSTDQILRKILLTLGISWNEWSEVKSWFHVTPPDWRDFAISHPHKWQTLKASCIGPSAHKAQTMSTQFEWPPILRISPPGLPRSTAASLSVSGLPTIHIDAVIPSDNNSKRSREAAASKAHADALAHFIQSPAPFCVILEDDAILGKDNSWMLLTDYDLYIPFSHNREHRPPDPKIRLGVLPEFGAWAYLCSRKLAVSLLPRLRRGEIADHALRAAARGMIVASASGNLANHDNECLSLVSEARRLAYIRHYGAALLTSSHPLKNHESKLIITVCSCRANSEKREAIRSTWGKFASELGIPVMFVVGGSETALEDDIIKLPCEDGYQSLPSKLLQCFKYVSNSFSFDFLFKCDDDTYVCPQRLYGLLSRNYLVGNQFLTRAAAERFASGGAGYLLSRDAVRKLCLRDDLPVSGAEDVIFTRAVLEMGGGWSATAGLGYDCSQPPSPGNYQVTCHRVTPTKMYAIHAGLTETPCKILKAHHPKWNDLLQLFPSGWLVRGRKADYGRWTISKCTLVINWLDWPPESFLIQSESSCTLIRD